MGRVWPQAQPAQTTFAKGCIWQNTPLCLVYVFSFPFYFDIWPNKSSFDIKKFLKYLETFMDLFMNPSCVVFFFIIAFCFVFCTLTINQERGGFTLSVLKNHYLLEYYFVLFFSFNFFN